MAIDFSLADMGYSEHVTGMLINDGEWFKGGYDAQLQHPGWTQMFEIPEEKNYVIADYYIEPSAGLVLETDWIEIGILPNGYKTCVKHRVADGGNFYVYYFDNLIVDENGDTVASGTIPGLSYRQNVPQFTSSKDALYRDLVLSVMLITRYYPTTNPTSNNHPSSLVYTYQIGSLDSGFISKTGTVYANDWPGRLGELENFTITNLETVNTYIKTHGNPIDEDIFTDEPLPDNPAGWNDTSHTGGGDGNYDTSSDAIDFPDLPIGGALTCGAIRAHRVLSATLETLMQRLWDINVFDPLTWLKIVEEPMDCIISLHALPFEPELNTGELPDIKIGNWNSELKAQTLASQYKIIDCGSLNIAKFWGSALDYSPYTEIEIYLPFIGIHKLLIEDVMGSTIHIKYYCDALTGDCLALVKCGLSILYTFTGNCKMQIPMTSKSTDAFVNAMRNGAIAGAGVGALAGLTPVAGIAISSALTVAGSKIKVDRTGAVDGNTGLMGEFVPYVILHRPVQSLAKNYNQFKGYPSNITSKLGNLTGYTEVEHINLSIPGATDTELEEIKRLLKEGVLI